MRVRLAGEYVVVDQTSDPRELVFEAASVCHWSREKNDMLAVGIFMVEADYFEGAEMDRILRQADKVSLGVVEFRVNEAVLERVTPSTLGYNGMCQSFSLLDPHVTIEARWRLFKEKGVWGLRLQTFREKCGQVLASGELAVDLDNDYDPKAVPEGLFTEAPPRRFDREIL